MQPTHQMLLSIYILVQRMDWNKTILGKEGSETARTLNTWFLKDVWKPYIVFPRYIDDR